MTNVGKVLVVDDEAHIRKFVGVLLQTLGGATVVQAANGREALEVYAREKPNLVLLDVNMPKLNGIETLRELRRIDPHCVVVMLTSLVNRQTIDECLLLGAFGYLRKDNPPEELALQMGKLISERFGHKIAKTG
jgi:CheY-like chemotaxis protein